MTNRERHEMGEHTGLYDSDGRGIVIGSVVRKRVTLNQEFHGTWADYEVIKRGMTPVLSYLRSEHGEKLPQGYIASPLSECYDQKLFLFATKLEDIRPVDRLVVVNR